MNVIDLTSQTQYGLNAPYFGKKITRHQMAEIVLDSETTHKKIFQIFGNSIGQNYDVLVECEDEEDKRFMDHFYSEDAHLWWAPYYADYNCMDVSPMTYSTNSDDSGVCLSPEIKTERDEDDISVVLDETDIAKICDFFQVKDEDSSSNDHCLMESDEGLNLPLLPKLGLDSDSALTHVKKSGSSGEYDDETEVEFSDSDTEYSPPNRKGCKNVLLWKFLLKTLSDSDDMVQWEDRHRGIFKFVDTVRISRLWGDQKKKDDMNFEKLSRGIRHYYRGGLMSRVEGRRLVYQFNWKKIPKCYRQKR